MLDQCVGGYNIELRSSHIVVEICNLLEYYAAYSGNSVPTLRQPIDPIFKTQEFLTLENGANSLS